MTSKEYIEKLDFEYLETYSLLRATVSREYTNHSRGTKQVLMDTGLPHPTAQRTNVLKKGDSKTKKLRELLSIEFTNQYDWMCAPIFREMVVFYDKDKKIISLLNICLSCDRVEDDNGNAISTDEKTFAGLADYFKSLGHDIEPK